MSSINDYGMAFERILIACLGSPTDSVYFSSFYVEEFAAKALLFAVCVKEMHINSKLYTKEEINQILSFKHDLPNDKDYIAIHKTIDFFTNKMKEQDRDTFMKAR